LHVAAARGVRPSFASVAVLADGRIVSGSRDSTLKVWSAQTGECEATLESRSDEALRLMRALRTDGRDAIAYEGSFAQPRDCVRFYAQR